MFVTSKVTLLRLKLINRVYDIYFINGDGLIIGCYLNQRGTNLMI